MSRWVFDQKEVRNDVKENLPQGWECKVFLVTSRDTGIQYWIQYLHPTPKMIDADYEMGARTIMLCDCPSAKFHQPLIVLGMRDFWCKHSKELHSFMKSKMGKAAVD